MAFAPKLRLPPASLMNDRSCIILSPSQPLHLKSSITTPSTALCLVFRISSISTLDRLNACAQNVSLASVLAPGCPAMDPASIICLVDASLDLAIKCASTLKRLNTIATQYKYARLTILSMVQNLDSLQLEWNRISVWSKSYVSDQDASENGLIERLERFLETGALVMEALDEDLSTYDPDDLSLTDRSRLIWNGQVLQDHQNRLRYQATSMTLLLQAIQL